MAYRPAAHAAQLVSPVEGWAVPTAQAVHAAEVEAQGQARTALRDSRPVSMPSTLMGLLSQIPQSTPDETMPPPPRLAEQLADDNPRGRRKRR